MVDPASPISASILGQLLSLQRVQVETYCRFCGDAIRGTTRKRFCGDLCRVKSYRKRLSHLGPYDELPPID